MAKLQVLKEYMMERLMVTVRDILEVVGATVMEYREEAARTHRENELLRRRLGEAGLWEPGLGLSGSPDTEQSDAPHIPGAGSCTRLDCDSLQEEDPEDTTANGERELCDLVEPESDMGHGEMTSGGLKTDHNIGAVELSDLFKIKVVSPTKAEPRPFLESDLIKTEPSQTNCGGVDEPGGVKCDEEANISERAGNSVSWPEVPASQGGVRPVRGIRSHSCPQCGKMFSHVSRLKIHVRIHTGEKPYSCTQCGKCFNNDGTLKNHQRVHTQVRLFSCSQCGMSFKDAYTCKKHQRVHVGRRLYCCSLCAEQFHDAQSLQHHTRTHTHKRLYSCTVCAKQFADLGRLTGHFRSHARENIYNMAS